MARMVELALVAATAGDAGSARIERQIFRCNDYPVSQIEENADRPV